MWNPHVSGHLVLSSSYLRWLSSPSVDQQGGMESAVGGGATGDPRAGLPGTAVGRPAHALTAVASTPPVWPHDVNEWRIKKRGLKTNWWQIPFI